MAILRVELVGDDADDDDNDEYCGRLVGTNASVVDTRRIATAVAVAITIVFKAGDARFMILVVNYCCCCWVRVDNICCWIRSLFVDLCFMNTVRQDTWVFRCRQEIDDTTFMMC
mmetsp:Transcript_13359/g.15219  ORF Transcript_13359/g.15219 Transcript_13359/m.15219 type:complete len:114 (+) Transcript_13359:136-477(+)